MKTKLIYMSMLCMPLLAPAQTKNHSVYDKKTHVDTLVIARETLGDVVVKASQRVARRDGNFVVFPTQKDVEASPRGIDLLELLPLPGLRVDRAMQSLTVNGGKPVFMINGREVRDYRLMNINPRHIKRIEYSNMPSTRYIDRGATGIINIVLKEALEGGSIVANASSDVEARMADAYLKSSYNKGRNEIAVEYNMNHRDYSDVPYDMYDCYTDDKRLVERSQKQNSPFHYTYHYVTAEYTHQHNDSTMFVASLSNLFFNNEVNGSGLMYETDRGKASTLNMKMHYRPHQWEPKLDLFYSHKLPHGQKIEANVVAQYGENTHERSYDYWTDDNQRWNYAVNVANHGWALSAEAVYGRQFASMHARLGAQYQHNFARNNYKLDNFVSRMTKDNTYVFAEVQGMLGSRLAYTLGTGLKYFAVSDGGESKSYFRNLSNLILNYRFSPSLSLTAVMRYTPSLPTLSNLSSVTQRTDDVEANQGNPHLKPSEELNSGISLHFNKNGWFADLGAGYCRVFSPIISTYYYSDELDLFVSTPQNASLADQLGVGASLGVKNLFSHFDVTLSGTWKHDRSRGTGFSHSHSNFNSHLNVQAFVKRWRASANFNLTPDWALSGEMLIRQERPASFSLTHSWKHVSAGLTWHCPFNNKGYLYENKNLSTVHSSHGRNWTGNNGNMVVFNFSWNLDFGKSFSKSQKTLWNGGYDSGTVK